MERYQQHFHALGSEVLLTIVTNKNPEAAQKILRNLRVEIDSFEAQFSRFKDESELSSFNKLAGKKVKITEPFYRLLSITKTLSIQTDGLYNPFILPALQRAGYVGSWPNPDSFTKSIDYSKGSVVPISELIIDNNSAQIPHNTAIDFGGIGKGYLLDQLTVSIEKSDIEGFWFSLGGDIICGGHDLHNENWNIGVGSAVNPNELVATLANFKGDQLGIATSGVTKRKGTNAGKEWHHIIDPRTGQSSKTDIQTVTVTARSAVVADVYAKCIVIGGRDHGEQYLSDGIIQAYVIQEKNADLLIRGEVK